MNSQGQTESTMDEGYWRAILSQGEIADGQSVLKNSELWEGFPKHAGSSAAEADTSSFGQDGRDDQWAHARSLMETGEAIELTVTGFNRGGLLVDWDGLRRGPARRVGVARGHDVERQNHRAGTPREALHPFTTTDLR
jgi:hypothetical protein